MSDKSFGDHMNRNIVKNPLLSTAVTGLSIEDLTHNAVLLPVVQSQELNIGQDQHIETQARTLAHTDYGISNFPSGDTSTHFLHSHIPINSNQNPIGSQKNVKIDKTGELFSSTVSKASGKTDDDFDVNEYFARLQGTRYVSAPLNSLHKDDRNANLEATEENLEEINLNEPEKSADAQQSLTADIAQNFSQLPTVLPQVASAVFSSFSNMLSMKSREQTPDDVKTDTGYQDAQLQRPEDVGVPLMGVDEVAVKEVAPPPKEPPAAGIGNYRISTKKKAYAQIPGLSSTDATQYIPFNAPSTSQNIPSYFVPSSNTNIAPIAPQIQSNQETQYNMTETIAIAEPMTTNESQVKFTETQPIIDPSHLPSASRIYNPGISDHNAMFSDNSNITINKTPEDNKLSIFSQETANSFVPIQNTEDSAFQVYQPQHSNLPVLGNTTIIPPPPMFSNTPRGNSQSSVGKSILPPSVARRISSNQPIIKTPQATPLSMENIFVPTLDAGPVPDAPNLFGSDSVDQTLVPSVQPSMYNKSSMSSPWVPQDSLTTKQKTEASTGITTPLLQSTLIPKSSIFTPVSNSEIAATNINIQPTPMLFPSSQDSIETSTLISEPTSVLSKEYQTYKSASPHATSLPSSIITSTPSKQFEKIFNPEKITMFDVSVPSNIAGVSQTTSMFQPQETQSLNKSDLPPGPTFYNPNTLQQAQNQITQEANQIPQTNISTAPEAVQPIPLPPKSVSAHSYRMTKKRPQYYAGPIEGIGAMSNNIKPVLQSVEANTFQGALLTPQLQDEALVKDSNKAPEVTQNIDQSTIQYEINRSSEAPLSLQISSNDSQHMFSQSEYNTSFDLSRSTTDSYEPPKQESKGFGIIGSLKSKLSSLDINVIQNSVTTFFDPAYNDTKIEASDKHRKDEQQHNYVPSQTQGSFEIFVPNIEPSQSYDHFHTYQTAYGIQAPIYNKDTGSQYYQNDDSYYQNAENIYSLNSYSDAQYSHVQHYEEQTTSNDTQRIYSTSEEVSQYNVAKKTEDISITNVSENIPAYDIFANYSQLSQNTPSNIELIDTIQTEPETTEQCVSDTLNVIPDTDEVTEKIENFHIYNIDKYSKQDSNATDAKIIDNQIVKNVETLFVDSTQRNSELFTEDNQGKLEQNIYQHNIENKNNDMIQNVQVKYKTIDDLYKLDASDHTAKLFDFSMPKDEDVSTNLLTNIVQDTPKENLQLLLGKKSAIDFFDKVDLIDESLRMDDNNDDNDLDICETCREVNKPEERETDDLTAQLIENITSPIQLSNPVEVPLSESNTPINDRVDFDVNQCAEITHITEETIETIHVQSATELLDDDQFDPTATKDYGWSTEEKPYTSTENPLDHDYDFKIDPNAIGFLSNNCLFFDNIPNNASDEIKAGFQTSHDEGPVLPRQMSIPTAPPAEEDSQSDETGGLDVHSIEQDAKKDFPIFEEYVIEPSETDDDKIEYIERAKSEEPVCEIDSFTNRVEKFKQLEESVHDGTDQTISSQKSFQGFDLATTNSPAVTFASYFDTGNYAADTHFRNSLSSPTQIRIPPGFEEEFQNRFSGIFMKELISGENKNQSLPFVSVPDCTTQTRASPTITFSTAQHATGENIAFTVSSRMSDTTDTKTISNVLKQESPEPIITEQERKSSIPKENIILPDFNSAFGKVFSLESEVINKEAIKDANILDKVLTTEIEIINKETFKETNTLSKVFTPESEIIDKEGFRDTKPEAIKAPQLCDIFGEKKDSAEDPKVIVPTKQTFETPQNLPDPINFFASQSQTEPEQKSESSNTGFNRLASYFASPVKPDHAKSFFELSQSQNHYRHKTEKDMVKTEEHTKNDHKHFFELSQSQNHYIDNKNIPQDEYMSNLALVRDLASNSFDFKPNDQIIKTVNYFTIEYNNITHNFNIGEPEGVKRDNKETLVANNSNDLETDELGETEESRIKTDMTLISIITNCKYCCNMHAGHITVFDNEINSVGVKYKKAMDTDNSDPKKDTEMQQNKDGSIGGQVNVNLDNYAIHEEDDEGVAVMSENRPSSEYTPVKPHWFYRVDFEGKSIWRGFSVVDSKALELAFTSPTLNENTLVPTDGGRFDVNVIGRLRIAVYWAAKPTNVRRCCWFYKGTTDARYVPYTEDVAEKLEDEYRHGITTGEWHRRLVLPNNELVVMHGPAVMVHFLQSSANDAFSSTPQSTMRPRVVRRGHVESEIEDVEPSSIDHLLLLCHGVGSACDMRFRSVEEVVDDFRTTSLQLIQSHYRNSYDSGIVGRVEVLPISWHATLHSGETGVDRRLAQITLDSIPRLRNFTNDTVLDVLFYTSPVFCQTIIDTVCSELNRIYELFVARNPDFHGGISLGGHSLGSVILYDLLCHQVPVKGIYEDLSAIDSDKTYVNGSAGTGQPTVKYPKLCFKPAAMYALGSPIAIFECIRGVESLGANFLLPTCNNFFNIFHPYDPIAYRIEPLINPDLRNVKPYLIPHHKGRKRMHLELKDTMARVGADIKQKLIESIKSTWSNMWKSQPPPTDRQLEKVVEEEMEKEELNGENKEDGAQNSEITTPEMLGKLNGGRRVDYVLQEAPFEMINEYLFAMSSHVCYWESEDTMLLMLREIYASLGVQPDCSVPQQSMTLHRTRIQRNDETIVMNASESPSTSRGQS